MTKKIIIMLFFVLFVWTYLLIFIGAVAGAMGFLVGLCVFRNEPDKKQKAKHYFFTWGTTGIICFLCFEIGGFAYSVIYGSMKEAPFWYILAITLIPILICILFFRFFKK